MRAPAAAAALGVWEDAQVGVASTLGTLLLAAFWFVVVVNRRVLPRQFVELIERATERIIDSVAETRWQFIAGEDNIDIFCLPDPPLPDRFKAVCLVKAPVEAVLRCLYDIRLRGAWDQGMVGNNNRTVVYFDRSISITYYQVGNVGTVSGRDFLDLRSLYQLEGGQGYLVVLHSVEWPDQPEVPGVVRAYNYATAQVIRKLSDTTCEVVNYVQCDLKGWLPTRLIRISIGGSMIKMFKGLRTYAESNAAQLAIPAEELERQIAATST